MCESVTQLQEAKSEVEQEKTAVEEARTMELLLHRAKVARLSQIIGTCNYEFTPISQYISELVQASASVTIEREYEVTHM